MYDDYNSRLLNYITEYVRENGVSPTIELMIQNVKGKTSKSTVHTRLQKMVALGLLVQKSEMGYYYPTSIDLGEVLVPKYLLEKACDSLENVGNTNLAISIRRYIQK